MYLLFDIGGTKIRVAVSDGSSLLKSKTFPSTKDFDETIKLLANQAEIFSNGQKIDAVCGSSRGVFDKTKSVLTDLSFFGWDKKPLKESLEKAINAPVFLENDAVLAGIGEAVLGAGKIYNIVGYLTISTQVGGAKIVNGHIDTNSIGFEPGNQIISMESGLTWEHQLGGDALERKYQKKAEEITDQNVWEETAKILAIGLNNVMVFWSPDIVVLGGGVMKSIDIERVKLHLSQILKIFPEKPEIIRAKLGDEAGLYGALEYLKQNLS